MRKILLVMSVLLFAAPAFAGTVTFTVTDINDGWATIGYSADANVSGFGLKIYTTVDANAVITDINNYKVGESVTGNKGYGIFPGTIDINDVTGVVDSNGTPVAPNDDPGASGTGLNTNTIIVEMGALYVEGNEPDLSGNLIDVKVDRDCNVCVEGEPVRGNVVLTDANAAITNLPVCAPVIVTADLCPGDVTGTAQGYHPQTPMDPPYFDANDWTGPDGDTDFDDLQALIYLLIYDGTTMVVSPVPSYAAAGDVTGTAQGYHPQTPMDPPYFDANDWTGPDGDIDFDDLQALIYLLIYDGTTMVYTCP